MIKRLVVGVAGTPALQTKIEHTVDLALRHNAEITVLSVVDVGLLSLVGPVPIGAGKHAQDMREERIERSHRLNEEAIAKFEAACRAANVPVQVVTGEVEERWVEAKPSWSSAPVSCAVTENLSSHRSRVTARTGSGRNRDLHRRRWHPGPAPRDGSTIGVEAVIDKDAASNRVARQLKADAVPLLTDVDAVYRDFGTEDAARTSNLTPAEARARDFPAGSMAPKVTAACEFAATGGFAGIGRLDDAVAILAGRAGTRVSGTG